MSSKAIMVSFSDWNLNIPEQMLDIVALFFHLGFILLSQRCHLAEVCFRKGQERFFSQIDFLL